MSESENALLAQELAKLGAKGAKIGAELAGVSMPDVAADWAAAKGPGLVARYLPTERFQTQLVVAGNAEAVLGRVLQFFTSHGRVANGEEAGSSPCPKVSGVIGSGFLKMNPAVIHAEVTAVDSSGCTLLVTAAAKEGLIKQRTAEKAVQRLAAALGGDAAATSAFWS